jgi:hypothetical protein
MAPRVCGKMLTVGWYRTHNAAASRPARANVLRLMTKGAVLRARDARAQGVHTGTLTRMVRGGELERVGPGRYRQVSADVSENHSALACGAVPSGVVCLLRALRFHNIGTQLPP